MSLTQQFPRDALGWRVLGAILKQKGALNEALHPMQRAVKLSPYTAEDHCNPGVTLKDLGRMDEAEASFIQALEINPSFVKGYYNLGNMLRGVGRLDEAESTYKKAIALKPDYAEAHNNLGVTLKALRKFDEAESSYRQAIALKPEYAEAHSNLGSALQDLGRSDEAASSYRQALLSNPDDAQAVHMLSALTGVNTKRAPLDYVEDLFDGYAERFDSSLVDQLDYRTPKAIAELIARNNQTDNLGSVLDLGCGTGLFGIEIAQVCDRIEGLDVSRKTLLKAQARGIYDKLVKQDLES